MEFIPIHSSLPMQIKAYDAHSVKVNDIIYSQSVIILPNRVIDDWPVHDLKEVTIEQAETLSALKPEVLIIGTGEKTTFPEPAVLAWFREHRISVEFMNTGAACRTFQVLTSESRYVIAALIFGE